MGATAQAYPSTNNRKAASVSSFDSKLPAFTREENWAARSLRIAALREEKKIYGEVHWYILEVIQNQTYGRRERPEFSDVITGECIAEALDIDPTYAEKQLADLAKRSIVARKRLKAGFVYRLAPENWADAPPVELKPRKEKEKKPPVEAVPVSEPLVLMPGRESRPIRFDKIAPRGVTYRNLDCPGVQIDHHFESEHLVVSLTQKPHSSAGSPDEKTAQSRTPVRVLPIDTPLNQQLTDSFREFFMSATGKRLDSEFERQILDRLAPCTPEVYETFCRTQVKNRFGRKGQITPSGLFLNWAMDQAETAREELQREQAAASQQATFRRSEAIHGLAEALDFLERNPELPADDLGRDIWQAYKERLSNADADMVDAARKLRASSLQ